MTGSVLVVGEALIDVVISASGVTSEHVGGSPANVAIGLGRLGRAVTLITSFGDDRHGHIIERRMHESSAQTIGGLSAGTVTSTAVATIDGAGAASYAFDIRWDPSIPAQPSSATVIHTGSLGAYLEPGASAVERLLDTHRATASITFDPNLRPSIMERAAARVRVERLLSKADVVKVSDEDLHWLYPGVDPTRLLQEEWLTSGPSLVVLTRGADGADAWTQSQAAHVDRLPVNVIDTVGAGDSFMSGLIDGLWSAGALGAGSANALASLPADRLLAILMRANRSAALTVSKAGAEPPTSSELADSEDLFLD